MTVILLKNVTGGTAQKQMFNLVTSSLEYTQPAGHASEMPTQRQL